MAAHDLLQTLAAAGVSVTPDGDRLLIRPASKLTDDQRAALRDAKAELLALLARTTPEELVEAIHACCDARGDTDANRAALLAECADLSLAAQADLTAHFWSEAVIWRCADRRCMGRRRAGASRG